MIATMLSENTSGVKNALASGNMGSEKRKKP